MNITPGHFVTRLFHVKRTEGTRVMLMVPSSEMSVTCAKKKIKIFEKKKVNCRQVQMPSRGTSFYSLHLGTPRLLSVDLKIAFWFCLFFFIFYFFE